MDLFFLKYLLPTDRKFFPLFEKAAANLEKGGKLIHHLMTISVPETRKMIIAEIEETEHKGDEITHEIFSELSKNFITPFDREDIFRLVSAIDDVLDYIHGSAKRIELYKINVFPSDMVKLAELIKQQTEELRRAVFELRNMRKMRDITDSLVRVNSIENHADDIFDHAVAWLFENETNAIELIKIKEVLAALETATDKCEDAANVIESIIVKMA
jgi:predicted phosphate transport protein (TIGR00153 family)